MSEISKQKKAKWAEANMNAALKLLVENKMAQRRLNTRRMTKKILIISLAIYVKIKFE